MIVAAVILLALLWYFGGAVKQSVLDRKTDRKVDKLEQKSDQSQQQANSEIREAEKTEGARAAEDTRREVEIKPELERARVNREQARANTQKAAIDYENSRQKISDPTGIDVGVLHERNCADFHELYPNEPGCSR